MIVIAYKLIIKGRPGIFEYLWFFGSFEFVKLCFLRPSLDENALYVS